MPTTIPFVKAEAAPKKPFFMGKPAPPRSALHLGAPAPSLAPPPPIDPLYTGYDGLAGSAEAIAMLGILGSATFLGIMYALSAKSTQDKALGWISGVGSGLLGLLYLGGKVGISDYVALPAVRVVPA